MRFSNFFGLIALAATVMGAEQEKPMSWSYVNKITKDPVDATFTVTKEGLEQSLDVPRILPQPNATSFDWWYFDAVNPDNPKEVVVVIFYLATPEGFPLRMTKNVSVATDVFLNFADGLWTPNLLDSAPPSNPEDIAATVSTDGNGGISGDWRSVGASFAGSRDGKFVVNVDNKERQLQGQLTLNAIAQPRVSCSVNGTEGESLEAASHVGWTNMIPDGEATVDFTFGDRKVAFAEGIGYHDKKWGDRPFHHSVKDWYWGHARLGPYSLVWLQSVSRDNKIYSNAFISHPNGGKRVSCEGASDAPKNVKIQHFDTYFEISFTFKLTEHLKMRVEKTTIIGHHGPFSRWSGSVSATVGGTAKLTLTGHALFQEFHF